jgi:hypothetical protein
MATVDIKIEGSLLIVTVTGNITANELIAVVLGYYPNNIVKDVIWDLSHGSLKSISQDGFGEIAKTAKMAVEGGSRQGRKTVFVGSDDRECALFRLYNVIAEVTGVPIKYNVFKTVEDAISWLKREG